jgi:hypothetical membrane protein
MLIRALLLGGILASITYIVTVIVGAAIRPGYSHIKYFVSELISAKAPNKKLLNPLFATFNILTSVFGFGLLFAVSSLSQSSGKMLIGTWGAIVIIAEALIGFAIVFFPMDERDTPNTFTGTMHIVLSGFSSLATMIGMLLIAICLHSVPGMNGWSVYSFISLAVVFVSGAGAAITASKNSPIAGLMERITIGGFLQWMMVMGIVLLAVK